MAMFTAESINFSIPIRSVGRQRSGLTEPPALETSDAIVSAGRSSRTGTFLSVRTSALQKIRTSSSRRISSTSGTIRFLPARTASLTAWDLARSPARRVRRGSSSSPEGFPSNEDQLVTDQAKDEGRVPMLERDQVPPELGVLYDTLLNQRGVVPNMFKTVANTPALALG